MVEETQVTRGRLIGVFGASGFGREVMPLLVKQSARAEPSARFVFVEPSSASSQNGVEIWGEADFFDSAEDRAFVVAIANGRIRQRLHNRAAESGAKPLEVRSASADVLDRVVLGDGAILCGNSTVSSDTQVGLGFQLNIGSYLAHDCQVGDFVTFGPNAVCAGNVVIEDYAYIGGGAMIRQGEPGKPLVIGAGAVIGMGAVVTRSVPPGVTVAGVPAKPLVKR